MPREKERRLYIASAIMLFLNSVIFLLMPINHVVPIRYLDLTNLLLGIGFWISSISGYLLLILVYLEERRKHHKRKQRRIFIFSNIITAVADSAFVAGIISLIVLMNNQFSESYVVYINIFLITLAFNVHWLFSRNFAKNIFYTNAGGRTNEND